MEGEGHTPSGERRTVTVLFADICGFTGLSERLDPEPLCALVNACFAALVAIVERHGGTVDKFIGDAVMVLFGAPVAHEDDPARACRTAIEMMAAMARFGPEHAIDWAIHIGINTGLVVAGGIGTGAQKAYTVMGDAVNVAARLLEAAGPGEIMVGPTTRRLVGERFTFDDAAPLAVKGRREPVEARRLRVLGRPLGRRMDEACGVMVGRADEQAALTGRLDDLSRGTGGAVVVLGEAGLGKSRLLATARAGAPGLRWAAGRCLSHGTGVAQQLVRALLRALHERAGEASAEAWVSGLLGADSPAWPLLGQLLGEPLRPDTPAGDAQTVQAATLSALRDLLRALATAGPLVLVCEDCHWADPSSIELLRGLLPLTCELPISLWVLARPEPGAAVMGLIAAARELPAGRSLELQLGPLADVEARALAQSLLARVDGDPALAEPVAARAGGNPLFVEELVRALNERGAAGPTEVPDSLQGLLLARMDRLPESTRAALRIAAVLGRSFAAPLLERVLARCEVPSRGEHVERLEAAGIVQRVRALPEPEYSFRHALLQEAAYASLLRSERARLHRAVGAEIERLYLGRGDELAPVLARHYYEAGEHERARTYLRLAGAQALAVFANREAEGHFRRALEQAGGLREQGELLVGLGEALFRQGRYDDALDAWRHAVDLLTALGDHDRVSLLYARSVRVAWWKGQVPRSLTLCQEGLLHARGRPPSPGRAALLHEAARSLFFNGRAAAARPLCRRALAMARSVGPEVVEIEARTTQGLLYRNERRFARARAELERAVALADSSALDDADLLLAASRASNNLAELLEEDLAELPAARACYERSAALLQRRGSANEALYVGNQVALVSLTMGELAAVDAMLPGLRRLAAAAEAGMGAALLGRVEAMRLRCAGETAEAVTRLEACAAAVRLRGDLEATAKVQLGLAELRIDRGEAALAESIVREAVAVAERGLVNSVIAQSLLSVVYSRSRRPAAAARALEEATRRARRRLGPWDRRHLAHAGAALAQARRRPDEVVALLQRAAEIEAAVGAPWLEARTHLALAQAHTALGATAAARRARADAERLLTRVGGRVA